MRFEPKYNRMHVFEVHGWNDDYVVDRNGNLIAKEDYYFDEIEMQVIRPEN